MCRENAEHSPADMPAAWTGAQISSVYKLLVHEQDSLSCTDDAAYSPSSRSPSVVSEISGEGSRFSQLRITLPSVQASINSKRARIENICSDDSCDGSTGSPKRRKVRNVSFGASHVRYLPSCTTEQEDNTISDHIPAHLSPSPSPSPTPSSRASSPDSCDEDTSEDIKIEDGPAQASMLVNKMIVQLLTTRNPSIVTLTLRAIVQQNSPGLMRDVRDRLDALLSRMRTAGKAALLPSCVVLRAETLPVLEWIHDCCCRALEYMHAHKLAQLACLVTASSPTSSSSSFSSRSSTSSASAATPAGVMMSPVMLLGGGTMGMGRGMAMGMSPVGVMGWCGQAEAMNNKALVEMACAMHG